MFNFRSIQLSSQKKDLNNISDISNLILTTVFAIIAVLCVIPIILIVMISLSDEMMIMDFGYRFIPKLFSTKAYEFLLKDFSLVSRAYMITIVVTLIGTISNILVNSLYAYAISRRDFPYRRIFSTLVLVTLLFSGGIAPFYYVYVNLLHVKNTLFALILPGLSLGFNVFIVRTFFNQNVPLEVIESARIDGAGEGRTFFQIVVPMALPILATIALFSSIFYWNDFFNSMLFIEKEKLFNLQFTMQRSLMNLEFLKNNLSRLGGASGNVSESLTQIPTEGVRMAMVVIGIGPIILAYPYLQKYFIKGLTVGAVKG